MKCGQPWDDTRAQDNDLSCTKRCGGRREPLSLWLVGGPAPGGLVAALFANAPRRKGVNPTGTDLLEQCTAFVTYRNDALGHGAKRSDAEYEANLRTWLPFVRRLLDGLAGL